MGITGGSFRFLMSLVVSEEELLILKRNDLLINTALLQDRVRLEADSN